MLDEVSNFINSQPSTTNPNVIHADWSDHGQYGGL
jgi:hypothetical protein